MKLKYKYSQKYLAKQSLQAANNNVKQLMPSNAINRNFSFHLTEFPNNSKQASYSNRSLTNELVLPKLNQTNSNTNNNKINNNINNNNNNSYNTNKNTNANSSSVMPVISFHPNKSTSLNNLISKFNTNAKSNANKLQLKFGTIIP